MFNPPKIITKRDVIRATRDRWKESYQTSVPELGGSLPPGSRYAWAPGVWRNLKLLDLDTCSEEDVAYVIGNPSWTKLECTTCEKDVPFVVAFNGVAWDEYGQTRLCENCLRLLREEMDTFKAHLVSMVPNL